VASAEIVLMANGDGDDAGGIDGSHRCCDRWRGTQRKQIMFLLWLLCNHVAFGSADQRCAGRYHRCDPGRIVGATVTLVAGMFLGNGYAVLSGLML
jgi:hypothetical protein